MHSTCNAALPDERFCFTDGDVSLIIGDVKFQFHSHLITSLSHDAASRLFSTAPIPDLDESDYHVQGSVLAGFRAFLSVLYCRAWEELPSLTKGEWSVVLKLAHVFGSTALINVVIAKLGPITTAVDRIMLARAYDIQEWMEDAYADLALSNALPSVADCERLGFHTAMQLARLREGLMQRGNYTRENVVPRLSTWFSDMAFACSAVVVPTSTGCPGEMSSGIESDLMAYACKPSSLPIPRAQPHRIVNPNTIHLNPQFSCTSPGDLAPILNLSEPQTPPTQAQDAGPLSLQLTGDSYGTADRASLTSSMVSLAGTSEAPTNDSENGFLFNHSHPPVPRPASRQALALPGFGTGTFEYRHGAYVPLDHSDNTVISAGRVDDHRSIGEVGSAARPVGRMTQAFVEDVTDIDE